MAADLILLREFGANDFFQWFLWPLGTSLHFCLEKGYLEAEVMARPPSGTCVFCSVLIRFKFWHFPWETVHLSLWQEPDTACLNLTPGIWPQVNNICRHINKQARPPGNRNPSQGTHAKCPNCKRLDHRKELLSNQIFIDKVVILFFFFFSSFKF